MKNILNSYQHNVYDLTGMNYRSENEINYTWATKGIGNNYNFSYKKIPKAGNSEFLNLPEKIKNILRLDKPDIIISKIINKQNYLFFAHVRVAQ